MANSLLFYLFLSVYFIFANPIDDIDPMLLTMLELPAAPTVYIVSAGETLWDVAEKNLGSAEFTNLITDANGDSLNPYEVDAGDLIFLPSQPQSAPSAPLQSDWRTHTVKMGETLWTIAKAVLGNGDKYTKTAWQPDAASTFSSDNYTVTTGQIIYYRQRDVGPFSAAVDVDLGSVWAASGGSMISYMTKEGDTLASVAFDNLGTSSRWDELRNEEREPFDMDQHAVLLTNTKVLYPTFEGDIRLTNLQHRIMDELIESKTLVTDPKGPARSAPDNTVFASDSWPMAGIPYILDPGLGAKALMAIARGLEHIQTRTCINFVKRTNQADYIHFVAEDGCWSFIGRIGGAQKISIGSGCEDIGTVAHECGHAIGLWHEQSRPDRDDFVTIQWDRIEENGKTNFFKYKKINKKVSPYDYNSIMHYPEWAFSNSHKPSIVTKDTSKQKTIGEAESMTKWDIAGLSWLARCPDLPTSNYGTMSPTPPPTQFPTPPPTLSPTKRPTPEVNACGTDKLTPASKCPSYQRFCFHPAVKDSLKHYCALTCCLRPIGGIFALDVQDASSEEESKPPDTATTSPPILSTPMSSPTKRNGKPTSPLVTPLAPPGTKAILITTESETTTTPATVPTITTQPSLPLAGLVNTYPATTYPTTVTGTSNTPSYTPSTLSAPQTFGLPQAMHARPAYLYPSSNWYTNVLPSQIPSQSLMSTSYPASSYPARPVQAFNSVPVTSRPSSFNSFVQYPVPSTSRQSQFMVAMPVNLPAQSAYTSVLPVGASNRGFANGVTTFPGRRYIG